MGGYIVTLKKNIIKSCVHSSYVENHDMLIKYSKLWDYTAYNVFL